LLIAFLRKLRITVERANVDIYDYYPKIDIGTIIATQEGPFIHQKYSEQTNNDIYHVRDSWGRFRRHKHSAVFFETLESAIKDKSDLDRLKFEDPKDPSRYVSLGQREKEIHNRFAPVSGVMGLFMPCWYLRGEVPFLMDIAEDEKFCHALVDKVMNFQLIVGEEVLRRTNTWDTAIWVYDS